MRFIPACAGNTRPACKARSARPVHPRVRGEHWRTRCDRKADSGSSPRARGTHKGPIYRVRVARFIPACAGNTWWQRRQIRWPSVHPRVRGEHHAVTCVRGSYTGSSPRARGTRMLSGWGISCPSVHPRVRGEHISALFFVSSRRGSSPRARGTRDEPGVKIRIHRFIPACAGNTCIRRLTISPAAVHPRVRGEHANGNPAPRDMRGSSPRARGTLPLVVRVPGKPRFIPACAGNTPSSEAFMRQIAVHPRVRGEHADFYRQTMRVVRFIPACAGNTSARFRGVD